MPGLAEYVNAHPNLTLDVGQVLFGETTSMIGTQSRNQPLSTATAKTQRMNFGGTDCALPIAHARKHKIPVDAFVVYTDNETWRGPVHACQELVAYRREMNIPAKLIMVAFTATKNSVADPSDPGSLNVVGLDASLPSLIQEFVI